jgi:hypothetical protein
MPRLRRTSHVKELLGHESLDTLQHYAPSTSLRAGMLTIHDLKKEHQRCHPREKDGCGS